MFCATLRLHCLSYDLLQNRKSARKKIHVRFTPLPPQQESKEGSASVVPTDTHTDTDGQGEESSVAQLTQEHQPVAVVQASPRPPSTPTAPGAFLVRNKPVVFHSSSVRLPRSTSQQNLPVYKYKLDTEVRPSPSTNTLSPLTTSGCVASEYVVPHPSHARYARCVEVT